MTKSPIAKNKQKDISKNRIIELFKQADLIFSTDKTLANRYVNLARKLAMKVKIRIPLDLKRRFCKHCYNYLAPGVNSRIRTRAGKVVIACLECRKFTRIPVRKKST
ncbi:MAG TPA: ribonuclease P protein component 4 [Candidatus Nanoarchaeia archaeon]|nr:ribonuclease P protein component 4 [Candidatus Nanoarchaeia archaeon]